jgi:hypothetical protein
MILNVSWVKPACQVDKCPPARRRHHSADYTIQQFAELFVFAIARDPVDKFESGVRQARSVQAGHKLNHYTMDDIMDLQIKRGHHSWVNEHVQPSTWRIGARAGAKARGGSIQVDFIGTVENFDADFERIVSQFKNISSEQSKLLLAHYSANAVKKKPKPPPADLDSTAHAHLSPLGIQRMCKSEVYGDEWRCMGYPSPC